MQVASVPSGYPSIYAYNSPFWAVNQTIGTVGASNLSLTGSSTITSTASQTLFLYGGVSVITGSPIYLGGGNAYLTATRIA